MVRRFSCGVFVVFILASAHAFGVDFNDWEPMGPEGANFLGVAVNPAVPSNALSVTTTGFVYETADGGTSWNLKSDIGNSSLVDFCSDGTSVLYALYYSGVYRSRDGGATWGYYPLPNYNGNGFKICVDPTNENNLYVLGTHYISGSGYRFVFHKSSDGGDTWSTVTIPASYDYVAVYGFAISYTQPDRFYFCGSRYIYSTSKYRGFAWKSEDRGENWADISDNVDGTDGREFYCVAFDPKDHNRVFIGGNSYCYVTTDTGQSWSRKTLSGIHCFGMDPNGTAGRVYAGRTNNIYISDDFGNSWISSGSTVIKGDCRSIRIAPGSGTLYTATDSGLFTTVSSGTTWYVAHNGICHTSIDAMAMAPSDPDTLLVAVSGSGVLGSDDCGETWTTKGAFSGCDSQVLDLLYSSSDPNVVLALKGFG